MEEYIYDSKEQAVSATKQMIVDRLSLLFGVDRVDGEVLESDIKEIRDDGLDLQSIIEIYNWYVKEYGKETGLKKAVMGNK